MALAPIYVDAPSVTPARFNLLDTVQVTKSDRAGLGVQYESEFCGTARAFSPACTILDLGDISVSVGTTRNATITSTGLPTGTYRIVWGDGGQTTGEAAQLSEPHTYAADGTYLVQVYGENVGAYAQVSITVTNGVASGPFADTTVQEAKLTNDGITTIVGEPFPIYHLFSCRLIGSADNAEERAMRSLELGASRAVEQGFQTVIGTGAVDVTPGGTAVTMVKGLGLLEEYAGENYGGVPVIHMTRLAATLLIARQAIRVVGDHLETGLGSLVVAGAGYNAQAALPSAPAAGAGWMYATGQVNIWEGKTVSSGVVPKNPYDNEFNALVERTYTPTYECFKAAVEVTESE